MELLREGGVEAVFAGHWHRNAESSYKNILVVTTNSCCMPLVRIPLVSLTFKSRDPSGFRIVTVDESEIKHEYFNIGIQYALDEDLLKKLGAL
jgi:hypothetical protein